MEKSRPLVLGVISLQVGKKKYFVNINGNEKFARELGSAVERGKDPAEALFFLAELGATLYHPDSPLLKRDKARTYEQFFGTHGNRNNALERTLTLVR